MLARLNEVIHKTGMIIVSKKSRMITWDAAISRV
jgi:hypothetical protein